MYMKRPISETTRKLILNMLGLVQSGAWINSNSRISSCILCYHSISKDYWEFSVDPLEFKKQIKFLSQTKKVKSLEEIINDKQINSVAITFDDGYDDIFKKALPILKKHGLKAAVFVTCDGKTVDRIELGNNKKLLNLDQIKKLHIEGWEIGFHSKTHKDLSKLNEQELKKEVIEGKNQLEKQLGFKLRYFSFPKGKYSKKIIKTVMEAGFQAAFTLGGGPVNVGRDSFKFNRIIVSKFITLKEFEALLTKSGLMFNNIIESIIRIKDNKLLINGIENT